MKTIFRLTEKYMQAMGLPMDLVSAVPEEQRCVKRISHYSDAMELSVDETTKEQYARGIISTVDVDADGDAIPPEAFVWDRFVKNPVVLFNHDLNCPIGYSDEVVPETGGQVRGRMRFGKTEEAQKVHQLMVDKVLRGFSISFIPLQYEMKGSRAFGVALAELQNRFPGRIDVQRVARIVQKALVVEYSVVSVPNNEHTLVTEVKGLKVVAPKTDQIAAVVEKKIDIRRVGQNIAIKRLGTREEVEGRHELIQQYRAMWGV